MDVLVPMKTWMWTLLWVTLIAPLGAEAQDLINFNQDRLDINRSGMYVLGGWAAGNMAISGWQYYQTEGSTKYFHQMNVFWNLVNLSIAGIGYYGAVTGATDLDLANSLIEQRKIEKILLFNAGLDVAYVTAGFLFRERAKVKTGRLDQFTGWGNSLILQGSFLFVFDLVMHQIHRNHASDLLNGLDVSVGLSGLALRYTF